MKRHVWEPCDKCSGTMEGHCDLDKATYEVMFPARCINPEDCEKRIIARLDITVFPDRALKHPA